MGSTPADTMAGEVVLVGTAKARPFRNVWMLEAARVLTRSRLTIMVDIRSHYEFTLVCVLCSSVKAQSSQELAYFGRLFSAVFAM